MEYLRTITQYEDVRKSSIYNVTNKTQVNRQKTSMHVETIHRHKKPAYEDEGGTSDAPLNNSLGNHVAQKEQNTTSVAERRKRASIYRT